MTDITTETLRDPRHGEAGDPIYASADSTIFVGLEAALQELGRVDRLTGQRGQGLLTLEDACGIVYDVTHGVPFSDTERDHFATIYALSYNTEPDPTPHNLAREINRRCDGPERRIYAWVKTAPFPVSHTLCVMYTPTQHWHAIEGRTLTGLGQDAEAIIEETLRRYGQSLD